jgi:hypothetical protein
MVVAIKDADNLLSKSQEEQIKLLEQQIDAAIKEDFGHCKVIVRYGQNSLHPRVQQKIIDMYKEAGWKMKFSKTGDGGYQSYQIEMSPKQNGKSNFLERIVNRFIG